MDLKKTYNKLSPTQKQNVLLLAQGAFPWAITPASRSAMKNRGLLDQDNNLLNKSEWAEFLADKFDPSFCWYCHGLDNTDSVHQLKAIQSLHLGFSEIPKKHIDRLKIKTLVVEADGQIYLDAGLAAVWPQWLEANEDRLNADPSKPRIKPVREDSPLPRLVIVRGLRALNDQQRAMFDQLPADAQRMAREMLLVEKPDVLEVVHYMEVVLKDEAWRVAA